MAVLTNVKDVKHVAVDIPTVLEVRYNAVGNVKESPPADGETEADFDVLADGIVTGTIVCKNSSGPKAAAAITVAGLLTVTARPWGGGADEKTTFAGCIFDGQSGNIPPADSPAVSRYEIPFRAESVEHQAT